MKDWRAAPVKVDIVDDDLCVTLVWLVSDINVCLARWLIQNTRRVLHLSAGTDEMGWSRTSPPWLIVTNS